MALRCGSFPSPIVPSTSFSGCSNPGGRVGLTTWAEDCPFVTWCHRELTASIPAQDPPATGRPEAPRFDTPARLEAALQQTGFTGIQIHSEDADFLYDQDEEWWGVPLVPWHPQSARTVRGAGARPGEARHAPQGAGLETIGWDSHRLSGLICRGHQAGVLTWCAGKVGHATSPNHGLQATPSSVRSCLAPASGRA